MVARKKTAAKKAPAKRKAKAAKKKERIRVTTPVGMVSYPYLVEPDTGRTYSDDKHKTDLAITKDDMKTPVGVALQKAVLRVGRDYFGDQKLKLTDFKNPFKDGDEKEQEHYSGCIVITPKSNFAPAVVGPDKAVFETERIKRIKGGDFGRAVVSVYPYSQQGGGVTLGLEVLQFSHEGSAVGGGRSASMELLDELDVDLDDLDEEVEEEESEAEEEAEEEEEELEEDDDDDGVII